ncbi:MAG: hypothetical protein QOJ70_3790 [Acidobacteriota bacterium]|jgi:hypothetical protein|nr:hypothetical protein [Acidobacteriota bacterium]
MPSVPHKAHVMKGQHPGEYCLILEGSYLSVNEAEHALRDPFVEDWVEQTGRFRIHNLNEMMIVPGVPLGQLGLEMIDECVFCLFSLDPKHPLTERKAEGVAEALARQDMFDEISIEPRWPADVDEPDGVEQDEAQPEAAPDAASE